MIMRTRLRTAAAALALVGATLPGLTASATAVQALPAPRLCADYAVGHVTLEVMGDSIAYGYGVDAGTRWTSQLASVLPGPSSAVWNGAISGSSVEDYTATGPYHFHVDFTKNAKPSVVLMNWRVNDQWKSKVYPSQNPTAFKAQYRQVLDEIHAASPDTMFAFAVSPWVLDTRLDDGPYNQWDYIVAVWQLKDEYHGMWVDWMRFMPKAGQSNSVGLLQSDLTHPTAAAQSVLAATTFEQLRSYCDGVWG